MGEDVWDCTMKIWQLFTAVMSKSMAVWLSMSVLAKDNPQVLYLLAHTSTVQDFFLWSVWVLVSAGPSSGDRWFEVSVAGTALLFPPLQFLPPPCLMFIHAVPEGLYLWLTLSPVLVLGHALLYCIVGSSTARAGNQLVQRVLFLILLLHLAGPSMALSWHLWESLE